MSGNTFPGFTWRKLTKDLQPSPQLVYVALTSRLLDQPILVLVGDTAAGKTATLEAALALLPPEAVYRFPGGSPTALFYGA